MMVLGINAIGTRHSGAATVLFSLLNELLSITELERVVLFASPERKQTFSFPVNSRLVVVDAPLITSNPILRFGWLQTEFNKRVRREGCHLVYNHNNLAGRVSVPQVLFIQQSLYFSREAIRAYFAPHVPRSQRLRMHIEPAVWRLFYHIGAAQSQRVIVQTFVMRQWIEKQLRIPSSKITVIPPSPPYLERPRTAAPALAPMREGGYSHWLYVGNDCPYKNLAVIERVARKASEARRRWRFHIVGDAGSYPQKNALVRYYRQMLGPELTEAYLCAKALIMPSLVETVGLPMLEAMALDIPVVAADRPYAREICGPSALYFDPYSPEELFNRLSSLEAHPELRQRLITAQRQVLKRFTHSRCAVWKVLSDILTERRES